MKTAVAVLMVVLFMAHILPAAHGATENAAQHNGWRVGVARMDITPDRSLWLGGFAARTRPSEGTLHPLWIKALALEDASGHRAVLVTSDILGYPKAMSERICDTIEQAHGLTRSQIILSASHTHCAPVIKDALRCMYIYDDAEAARLHEYAEQFEARVVALVDAAFEEMEPAALFAGNGIARIAVNRRNNSERDLLPTTIVAGPHDHAVPTLQVSRPDGSLIAVVFGYACHATVLNEYLWNGDYPGFAQIALEEKYPGAMAMFFAGCGADQNAMPRRSIAFAEQYGKTLAAAVERAMKDVMRPLAPSLTTTYQEIMLALEPTPDIAGFRERVAETTGYEERCNQWMLDQLEQGETLPDAWSYPVQLWRLGDQTLVTLGGEVTVSYAINIKERLGQDVFVMGYANDQTAYIPSETILEEGGYEGDRSQLIYGMPGKWLPGIESQILDTVETLHDTVLQQE